MSKCISFIHLSDIHFTQHSGDRYDLDEDLRNELLKDIEINAKKIIGQPKSILVCGDIAFKGKENEYEAAKSFLNQLCTILGIPETFVLCVPGNHDVDHDFTKSSKIFSDVQSLIAESTDLNETLKDYFRDEVFRSSLFKHIHQYNQFAGKFSCNIVIGDTTPTWWEDFVLNDSSVLRIHGLNSTIISNHMDDDQRLMVLGEHQIPKSEEGVTSVSLCHHPPKCWKDADEIEPKLNARVHVQLYGHKHSQLIKKTDNSLIVGSGSMHPSRSEKKWKPRYNWLSFSVEKIKSERQLKVEIYPRVLKEDKSCFIADINNCGGREYVEYLLCLKEWGGERLKECKEVYATQGPGAGIKKTIDSSMAINPLKTLTYRFLDLSFVKRSLILSKLSLIDEKDEGVEHINILEKIFKKAQETTVLDTMWEEVNTGHNDGEHKSNPFKK